jgi:hypothetical protein
MRRRRLLLVLALTLTLIGVVGSPVPAQDIDVRVSITYGFDGLGKPGRWTPVVVRLSNLGDAIRGELAVRSVQGPRTSMERHPFVVREEVHIGKGAGEVLRYIVPVGTPALPVEVTLRREDEVIYREQVDATSRIAPEALVVSLSSDRSLESLLSTPGSETEGIRLRASGPIAVAYPLPEFLPEAWHGYHGVDLLFLGDAPLNRLSSPQWTAVLDWVTRGGVVIVTDPRPGAPGQERIASLWDEGNTTDKKLDGAFTTRRLGAGRIHRLDFAAPRLTGRDQAATTARRSIREVALSRAQGAPHPSLPVLVRRQPFNDPVNQAILDGPVYNYPSRWLIALALAAYLAAFTVLIRRMQRGNRRVAPALIGVPLAVAAAFYLVLSVANPAPRHALIEIQRITGTAEAPIAHVERDVLALAAEGRAFALFPPVRAAVIPIEGQDNRVHLAGGKRLLETTLPRWREAHYYLADRAPAPLQVRLIGDAQGGAVELSNDTGHVIEETFLVFSSIIYDMGSVSPGQNVERRYDAASPASWEGVPSRIREVVELRQASLGPVGSAAEAQGLLLAVSTQLAPVTTARPPFDTHHSFAIAEIHMPVPQESEEAAP